MLAIRRIKLTCKHVVSAVLLAGLACCFSVSAAPIFGYDGSNGDYAYIQPAGSSSNEGHWTAQSFTLTHEVSISAIEVGLYHASTFEAIQNYGSTSKLLSCHHTTAGVDCDGTDPGKSSWLPVSDELNEFDMEVRLIDALTAAIPSPGTLWLIVFVLVALVCIKRQQQAT